MQLLDGSLLLVSRHGSAIQDGKQLLPFVKEDRAQLRFLLCGELHLMIEGRKVTVGERVRVGEHLMPGRHAAALGSKAHRSQNDEEKYKSCKFFHE